MADVFLVTPFVLLRFFLKVTPIIVVFTISFFASFDFDDDDVNDHSLLKHFLHSVEIFSQQVFPETVNDFFSSVTIILHFALSFCFINLLGYYFFHLFSFVLFLKLFVRNNIVTSVTTLLVSVLCHVGFYGIEVFIRSILQKLDFAKKIILLLVYLINFTMDFLNLYFVTTVKTLTTNNPFSKTGGWEESFNMWGGKISEMYKGCVKTSPRKKVQKEKDEEALKRKKKKLQLQKNELEKAEEKKKLQKEELKEADKRKNKLEKFKNSHFFSTEFKYWGGNDESTVCKLEQSPPMFFVDSVGEPNDGITINLVVVVFFGYFFFCKRNK